MIKIETAAYFIAALSVLILPMGWFMSLLIAMSIHELGHIAMLALRKIPIKKIVIGPSGAKIHTGYQTNTDELFTAAAGPALGLIAVIFIRHPMIRICCIIQSFFNLLPIVPFDGGRILRAICAIFAEESRLNRIYRLMQVVILGIIILFLFY